MTKEDYKAKSKTNGRYALLGIVAIFAGSFLLGGVNGNTFGSVVSTLGSLTVGATIVYEIYLRVKVKK